MNTRECLIEGNGRALTRTLTEQAIDLTLTKHLEEELLDTNRQFCFDSVLIL